MTRTHFFLIAALGLLAWLPSASASVAQRGDGAPDPETPLEIFNLIREEKDRTPRKFIETLGEMKTEAALDYLKRSVDLMRGRWAKQHVFSAMRHFLADEVLREDVIKFARSAALAKPAEDATAAAAVMSTWGAPVQGVLWEIADDAWEDAARSYAIKGVHKQLAEHQDKDALRILLEAYDVPASGSTAQGIALFQVFGERDHLREMAKFVGGTKSPRTRQLLILDAMARHARGAEEELDKGVDRVLEQAMKHRDPMVQYRALRAVARRGGTGARRAVERLTDAKDPAVRRAALLAVVLSSAHEGKDSRGADAEELAQSGDPIERQAAAIGLAEVGGEDALSLLHQLTRDEDWAVTAEAIRALVRLREASSIPVLIEGLDAATGRLRGDFRDALVQLTGLELGLGTGSWKIFWKKEGETFAVPSAEAVAKSLKERQKSRKKTDSEVAFYGMEILSDAFVLVVDTSGSMQAKVDGEDTRLDVAKVQMTKTLQRVRDGVLFNVIPFSGQSRPLSDGLEPIDPEAREEAIAFVERLREGGGTNIYDSLSAAFDDERVDTIYLLSDGAPSGGAISDPLSLRAEIERWNSVRGIKIHAIAVGQDHPLLKGLAKDSGGDYVRVD